MLERLTFRQILANIFKVLVVFFVFLIMYIPVLLIIYQSFNVSANSSSPLIWGGFTFEHYEAIFTNRRLYTSILDSLLVSLWTTLIATFFGLIASIGMKALSKKARRRVDFLNQIPMLNSEIVTGISIMLIFSLIKPLFPNVFGFPSMLVAHVFFTVPYVIMMVLPKLDQTDEALFEAALDLGCPPWKVLLKVIIPSLSTAILTGALVAFTLSIDDFVISFYTQGNGFFNISNYVYAAFGRRNFNAGAYAFNALLTFVTLFIVFLVSLKTSKKKGVRK